MLSIRGLEDQRGFLKPFAIDSWFDVMLLVLVLILRGEKGEIFGKQKHCHTYGRIFILSACRYVLRERAVFFQALLNDTYILAYLSFSPVLLLRSEPALGSRIHIS